MKMVNELTATLMEYSVPSLLPGTGMALLGVEKKVRAVAKTEDNPGLVQLLDEYALALRVVAEVSIAHQGAVIAQLGALVRAEKGGE